MSSAGQSAVVLSMSPPPNNTSAIPTRTSTRENSNDHIETQISNGPLDAFKDARLIVRLSQCPQCSYPLQEPVTLPCGNSLCKKCIPESHLRRNISYPATPNRLQGFTCPFESCRKEHADGDCSMDVVLNKISEIVRSEIAAFRGTDEASETLLRLEIKDRWSIAGVASLQGQEPRIRIMSGGRLCSTYAMAEGGELEHDSEIIYTPVSPVNDTTEQLDHTLLDRLKDATRAELDCQVCYALLLDPLTTACGHTFCRKCVHRVLDHMNYCPVCRQPLNMPPATSAIQAPSNSLLIKILTGLYPEAMASRAEAAKEDEANVMGELDVPLFICTLSFPTMPTFLHIFEPRYRLMIRRAVESGNRKFGMVLYNQHHIPQGDLGPVSFYAYGTLLHIVNMHLMPDGRSLVETTGISRFRVVKHGTLDGYMVGKVERVDDISLAAEEALEAEETSATPGSRDFSAEDYFGATPQQHSPRQSNNLDRLSTQELMNICTSFVKKMQHESAPWLHSRVTLAYGECPDDPALFPWWFASILPTAEKEKYNLLVTSSVRQRLKMCASWIAQLEAQRWYADFLCSAYSR